jgi:hypothetical protein
MKNNLTTIFKSILADRLLSTVVVTLILLCLAYCIYIGVSLRPSDLQVAVHYTAFGTAGFYREKWYYLVTFIVFGILVATIHTTLVVKLHMQGRRQIAFMFAWTSILLMIIAFLMTQSVLKVAFL